MRQLSLGLVVSVLVGGWLVPGCGSEVSIPESELVKASFGGGSGAGGFGGERGSVSGLASYDEFVDLEEAYVEWMRECELLSDGPFIVHSPSLPRDACLYRCALEQGDCSVAGEIFCADSDANNASWESCTEECNRNFVCGDGTEVDAAYQCDTYVDCDDGSDEQGCEALWFDCGEGTPILSSNVCDGTPHCPNGQDEADCPEFFSCDFEKAVPEFRVCDGRPNCSDGSDEEDCADYCE